LRQEADDEEGEGTGRTQHDLREEASSSAMFLVLEVYQMGLLSIMGQVRIALI
jgi:hypothetical protein